MAGNHHICSKTDQAIVAYLIGRQVGTSGDVFPGKRSEEKVIPCTVVWSHTAKPDPEMPYSGNWLVHTFIEIRTSGVLEVTQSDPNQPRLDSDDRVSATVDSFFITGDNSGEQLADAITQASVSAVDDFTMLNCRVVEANQGFNPRNANAQGNCWVDTIHLESLVAPKSGLGDSGALTS